MNEFYPFRYGADKIGVGIKQAKIIYRKHLLKHGHKTCRAVQKALIQSESVLKIKFYIPPVMHAHKIINNACQAFCSKKNYNCQWTEAVAG